VFGQIVIKKDSLLDKDHIKKITEAYNQCDCSGINIWIDVFLESPVNEKLGMIPGKEKLPEPVDPGVTFVRKGYADPLVFGRSGKNNPVFVYFGFSRGGNTPYVVNKLIRFYIDRPNISDN
jgi:hypothetical protein